jgi:hypothetical protein
MRRIHGKRLMDAVWGRRSAAFVTKGRLPARDGPPIPEFTLHRREVQELLRA